MKFRVKKIAAAMAAGLGVSVVGTAHADSILFPYFAVSDTVTSIFSVMNMAGTKPGNAATTLRYSYWYKAGASAGSLSGTCRHIDIDRNTSLNDVVTFDSSGHFAADPSVLFEPTTRQINAKYPADAGQDFAVMNELPARGFLLVDNSTLLGAIEGTLQGEVFMIDYAAGAVWGYAAYNAAPTGVAASTFDFSDSAERQGEVLAGSEQANAAGVAPASGAVPTAVLPIASNVSTGDVTTKFFVTPIAHDVVSSTGAVVPALAPYQDRGDLAAAVRLDISAYTGDSLDVMFDRDENPISGVISIPVVCDGGVGLDTLLDANILRQYGDFGGWTAIRTVGAQVLNAPGGANAGARTIANNQAIIMKLEYNVEGSFIGESFRGAFNNSIWLRRGIRESVVRDASGNLTIGSVNAGSADAPIWVDVADDADQRRISAKQ